MVSLKVARVRKVSSKFSGLTPHTTDDVLRMGIVAFWFLATLLVGVALSSSPVEAQPFAYVTTVQTF